jgi:hypothetical protein
MTQDETGAIAGAAFVLERGETIDVRTALIAASTFGPLVNRPS